VSSWETDRATEEIASVKSLKISAPAAQNVPCNFAPPLLCLNRSSRDLTQELTLSCATDGAVAVSVHAGGRATFFVTNVHVDKFCTDERAHPYRGDLRAYKCKKYANALSKE